MEENGILYIVATAIGNLQDLTFRACSTLLEADYVLCEDTRRAGILLKHIKDLYPTIESRYTFISYYDQIELQKIPLVISMLKQGKKVALISDAGTPLISDPGFKLVRECVKENIHVESIPGPSSIISALVSSGLPPDKFSYFGYLPHKESHRLKMLDSIKTSVSFVSSTVILLEAPHKLLQTLEDIKKIFGDIAIVLARELTKVHEEIARKTIGEFLIEYEKRNPRGEYVILFNTKEQ